jgi:GAF domain-containing protein
MQNDIGAFTGWGDLVTQASALVADEADPIANAANLSSLLYHTLPEVNWVGFYLLKDGELVVGPFQGKPACVRIPLGRGVCGTAAARRESIVVDDVELFDGHIPCDAASRSELVVPIIVGDALYGVLDVDAPIPARFDDADRAGLERIAAVFSSAAARGGRGSDTP